MRDAKSDRGLSQILHRAVHEETQLVSFGQLLGEGLALVTSRSNILSLKSLLIGHSHFPREHSAAQRYASDDADVGLLRYRKNLFCRFLGQKIVFQLDSVGPA